MSSNEVRSLLENFKVHAFMLSIKHDNMSDKKITLTVSELLEFGNKCWWESKKYWEENPDGKLPAQSIRDIAEYVGVLPLDDKGTIYIDQKQEYHDVEFYFNLKDDIAAVIADKMVGAVDPDLHDEAYGQMVDKAVQDVIVELSKRGLL